MLKRSYDSAILNILELGQDKIEPIEIMSADQSLNEFIKFKRSNQSAILDAILKTNNHILKEDKMDEIQKVLVKAGRKDLAQKYYLKIAATKNSPTEVKNDFIAQSKRPNTVTHLSVTTDEVYGASQEFYIINLEGKTAGFFQEFEEEEKIIATTELLKKMSSYIESWQEFYDLSDEEKKEQAYRGDEHYGEIYYHSMKIKQEVIKTLDDVLQKFPFDELEVKQTEQLKKMF